MSRYFLDDSQGNALIGHHGQGGATEAVGAGPLNPYFVTGFSEDSASRICLEMSSVTLAGKVIPAERLGVVVEQYEPQLLNGRDTASGQFSFGVPLPQDDFRADLSFAVVDIASPQGHAFIDATSSVKAQRKQSPISRVG